MAKHVKDEQTTAMWKIIAIVGASVAALAIILFILAYGGVLDAVSSLFGNGEDTGTTQTTLPTTTTTSTPPPAPVYRKPDTMNGMWLTPGRDYYLSEKNTGAAVQKQIDSAFEAAESWAFNTLLLPLDIEDDTRVIYPSTVAAFPEFTDADGKEFDPVTYAITKARERNMYTYVVLDLHVRDGEEWDPRTDLGSQRILKMVEEAAVRYKVDGFFISGFAFDLKQVKSEERDGTITALNALMEKVTTCISQVDQNYYTGLLSYGIWAHKSVDERGSETGEYYEEFTDGCADTLAWLEKGLFQCVMVQNYTSTAHPTASFQNVLKWWDAVAEKQQLPLYISHCANRIGSYLAGWKSTDQLAQQYLYCKSATAWQGSCYDSFTSLNADTSGMTETLKRAFEGTLDEEFIYKKLTISVPNKTKYTTTESTITLQGAGDKNFPLTVNGQEMELTDRGYFSLFCQLSVGENQFVISHKGTTKTYTVTYKQMILQSVSPNSDMTVDGGNQFVISAIARKGSSVTASINGTSIKLTENELKEEESGNVPSDFAEYKGTYTIPKGKVGESVSLGAVKITATYNGLSETKTGGKLTVTALPVPTTTTTLTNGSGTTVPSGTPIPAPNENVEIVTIRSDYAETFSGGSLVDDYSRTYNSYLPKGTTDYLVSKVYYSNQGTTYNYYLLASGKRVYEKDATLSSGGLLTYTQLANGNMTVTDTHTQFSFDTTSCIPVYVRTKGQKYRLDTTSKTPSYDIAPYSQTTTDIDIEFHYLSEKPALPDISSSPLFSSAQWLYDEDSQAYVLRLTLKKTGGFYGVSTKWNGNTLQITFLNPANIANNTETEPLKGVSILLDPGHGSDNDKAWEAPYNLSYAQTLKTKLEALGATVDMTRTTHLGTGELSLQSRVQMSQTKGYHLVISVHMNASANGKATGATVHYYSENSYVPSKVIYDKMHEVETAYGVGTDANGTPRADGTVWGTLYMTRSIFHCPSVLLECAFLDNAKDKEALSNPEYREKLMQAVTDGVIKYFSQQK
ncbi:MAG: N-acetylmuramoyl-L-alanine amidase [Clostridia bacterium]|nr:N-acetylmuramoyl-L-alanine amidase [Clostridia bacterium]